MRRRICLLLWLACLGPDAWAQSLQRVDVPLPEGPPMPAWMTLPTSATPPAAVMVVHGSGGLDGRAGPYIRALKSAGFATFEVELFKPNQRPKFAYENVPHMQAALDYL